MNAHPKLSLVSRTDRLATSPAESMVQQWDCEDQLVGALLHMSAAQAAPLLHLIPDTVIWRPDNRWAYEIVRTLVADGRNPDPVLVLSTAKHQPAAESAHSSEAVSAQRHHQFAVHLAALYTHTVNPAAVRQYAREVLDDAYRRAIADHGTRMQQLAESGAPRTVLTDYLTAMRAELADLWRRAEAAARPPRRAS